MTYSEPKNQQEYETTLAEAKKGKVVVYYTATWCGPCRMIAKPFSDVSDKYPNIKFIKVDVDNCGGAADVSNISGVPHFRFFNGAALYKEFSGANQANLNKATEELNNL